MTTQLLEAIINGETGIMVTLSARDLRDVVDGMVSAERRRISEEAERLKELPCLTRKQVAAQLGIHINTVIQLEKRGELTPEKIGVKIRFRQSDINDYLNINRLKTT